MRSILALVMVALTAGVATAQDRLDALAAAVDRTAGTPRGETAVVERMAAVLGLSPDRVRVARVETRLGWGDLFIAQRVATRGGHALEKVAVARRTGVSWTEIAEEARVDPAALADDVTKAWPDVARSLPATPTSGASSQTAPSPAPAAPAGAAPPATPAQTAPKEPAPADEIRDRMLRGGGTRR